MKVGIDLVSNARLQPLLKHAKRLLAPAELSLFNSLSPHRQLEFLSGRWAVKEAINKCGTPYRFHEIVILNDETGAPTCNLANYLISLSHEKNATVAVAIKLD